VLLNSLIDFFKLVRKQTIQYFHYMLGFNVVFLIVVEIDVLAIVLVVVLAVVVAKNVPRILNIIYLIKSLMLTMRQYKWISNTKDNTEKKNYSTTNT